MANADLDKQPDSVSSVLKVFGILQALARNVRSALPSFPNGS
ncbi:Transcriptional regulator kdgR [Serratia plymuthica]|nr:Transcriptional regulator kdgR [Serratia plymuthica]